MRLKSPNLDDRDFHQLVDEAKRIINSKCPEWTDLSPGDPGIVILEVFAHLTETMIYRLNRLPEKAYVEFLRLIGVKLGPPAAASARLHFTLSKPQDKPVEIPRGTRVTLARTGAGAPPPIFVVLQTLTIPARKTEVDGIAYHCDLIEAEEAEAGTGLPGFSVTARHPPIVASTSEDLELIVGVEAEPDELTGRVRAIEHNGKAYAVWQEVEEFGNLVGHPPVYIADRITGTITFAPAARLQDKDGKLAQAPQALAEVPKAGRKISLWYCSGGGLSGNVAANSLTTLKDPIPGVTVTNPDPAAGGSDAETLDNALVRGPQQLHSLQRAVTARDFELLALRSSGAVARAKAYTRASLWRHATPGTVGVLVVPAIPEEQRPDGVVTEKELKAHQTQEAIATVQQSLDERKPLATTCVVEGVKYKQVKVEARAVIHRGEDAETVQARVLKRLHQTINPLPSSLPSSGWLFGNPLRVSHVYDIMLAEPGVSFVDNVRLVVDQVPEKEITALAADVFQPHTWYATTGAKLFRSMDDGEGWELINSFPDDEETVHIRISNIKPGQLAVVTNPTAAAGSRLYISDDCGETWRRVANTTFAINDLAWTSRQGDSVLIMATNNGLFELLVQPGANPVQIVVDAARPNTLGFEAVAAAVGVRGTPYVAAAVRSISGVSVYLSTKGGPSNSYDPIGLKEENVNVLEVQQDGPRTFLWAGLRVAPGEAGKGAVRWELQAGSAGAPTSMIKGWAGGSCNGLAFSGQFVFAATHDNGVLWLDLSKGEQASWRAPLLESGLKIREDNVHLFQEVTALAAASQPATSASDAPPQNIVMAGGSSGIYRSTDNGTNYQLCSNNVFLNRVTVSPTRLFCSGDHEVEVVSEDEAK
jgi:3-hydroxymyristoyl/3-hydroxydecanoyl-(acyl carrier protein) dehydratase